jgi:hypothetical protein
MLFVLALAALGLIVHPCAGSEGKVVSITVQADKPGAKINPAMWGIFLEDVNFGADGGLYAELVKNRSFEFPDRMMGWTRIPPGDSAGGIEIRDADPFNKAVNPLTELVEADVRLDGVTRITGRGTAICLTSADLADENSFEYPVKVSPKTVSLAVDGPRFRYAFPANSLTVLRLKAGNE